MSKVMKKTPIHSFLNKIQGEKMSHIVKPYNQLYKEYLNPLQVREVVPGRYLQRMPVYQTGGESPWDIDGTDNLVTWSIHELQHSVFQIHSPVPSGVVLSFKGSQHQTTHSCDLCQGCIRSCAAHTEADLIFTWMEWHIPALTAVDILRVEY